MSELEGCGVVVTGAGQGLGRGIALALAARGGRVVALDVNADGAAETARMIEETGGSAWSCRTDVTDEGAVDSAVGWAASRLGGLGLVINGAGSMSSSPMPASSSRRMWRQWTRRHSTEPSPST